MICIKTTINNVHHEYFLQFSGKFYKWKGWLIFRHLVSGVLRWRWMTDWLEISFYWRVWFKHVLTLSWVFVCSDLSVHSSRTIGNDFHLIKARFCSDMSGIYFILYNFLTTHQDQLINKSFLSFNHTPPPALPAVQFRIQKIGKL